MEIIVFFGLRPTDEDLEFIFKQVKDKIAIFAVDEATKKRLRAMVVKEGGAGAIVNKVRDDSSLGVVNNMTIDGLRTDIANIDLSISAKKADIVRLYAPKISEAPELRFCLN